MSLARDERRAPYEFDPEDRRYAFEKAKFRCSKCHKKHSPEHGVHLQAHHILPISVAIHQYPHLLPEIVGSLENLAVLCENCHKNEHRKVQDYSGIVRKLDQMSKRIRA